MCWFISYIKENLRSFLDKLFKMEYNDKWTREKFLEYRKLKRLGYTDNMLIEHFGEDIYHSGIYSKKSTIMPWLDFITEIIITPEYSDYKVSKRNSDIYPNKFDYLVNFEHNNVKYIISLFFYIIEDIETYNILLTTEDQWFEYEKKLNDLRYKGYITDGERNELVNIVETETGFNQLYPVMKKTTYILFDLKNELGDIAISIGETRNIVKINLYRNIIKNSFPNVKEIEKFDIVGNKYYLYKIKI
jgi:hypothetical protein